MEQQFSVVEIDARLAALQAQRDAAMNHAVVLSGQLAKLNQQLQLTQKQLADLMAKPKPD